MGHQYYIIVENSLLYILIVSSVVLIVITFMRYLALIDYMKMRKEITHRENIFSTG